MQPARRWPHPMICAALVVLAAAGLVFGIRHARDVMRLVDGIGSLDVRFVVAGILCSGLAMANRGLLNQAAHRAVGLDASIAAMARTAAVGFAAQKMIKSAGAVGLAVFVRHGRRRGHAPGSVAAACVLSVAASFIALGVLLVSAIAVLSVTDRLTGWWIATAVGFGVYALAVVTLVAVIVRSRRSARRLWSVVQRIRRRFTPRRRLGPEVAEFPDHLFDALAIARTDRRMLVRVLLHGMTSKAIGAVMLALSVSAVGLPVSTSEAVVIYATALAAAMVTIVPGGFGAVEASTTALLVASGAPMTSAALAVVLFRFFDLLLPVIVGAIAARRPLRSETAVVEMLPPALVLAPAA